MRPVNCAMKGRRSGALLPDLDVRRAIGGAGCANAIGVSETTISGPFSMRLSSGSSTTTSACYDPEGMLFPENHGPIHDFPGRDEEARRGRP